MSYTAFAADALTPGVTHVLVRRVPLAAAIAVARAEHARTGQRVTVVGSDGVAFERDERSEDDELLDADGEGGALLATKHASGVRAYCERKPRVRARGLAALFAALAVR